MDKNKIHYIYAISILTLIIIILISVKWNEVPKLVEYTTFALTLSSLLLAILAIAHSLYSNNIFSNNIVLLNSICEKILKASNELNLEIKRIPVIVENFEDKTEETKKAFNTMTEKTSNMLVANMFHVDNEEDFNRLLIDFWENDKLVEYFCEKTTFATKCLLYACKLSRKNKKTFVLDDLFDNYMYYYGIVLVLSCLNLIETKIQKKHVTIYSINKTINDKIEEIIYQYAKKEDWVKWIELIEKYFNQ